MVAVRDAVAPRVVVAGRDVVAVRDVGAVRGVVVRDETVRDGAALRVEPDRREPLAEPWRRSPVVPWARDVVGFTEDAR